MVTFFRLIIILLLFNSSVVFCQSAAGVTPAVITGTITNQAAGTSIQGVSVKLKGTGTAAITDAEGKFSILGGQTGILVFSSVGFSTKEVPLTGAAVLNVTLQPVQQRLDEVVVVRLWYSTEKKHNRSYFNAYRQEYQGYSGFKL